MRNLLVPALAALLWLPMYARGQTAQLYNSFTDATGACGVAVSQYKVGNMTKANDVVSLNPYSLAVSMSGCTTSSQSGLTITATGSQTVSLPGC